MSPKCQQIPGMEFVEDLLSFWDSDTLDVIENETIPAPSSDILTEKQFLNVTFCYYKNGWSMHSLCFFNYSLYSP